MSESDFQSLVNHVVRFRYSAGSSPQDFRTVAVKKVEQFAGKTLIAGLDMAQLAIEPKAGELVITHGYRRYYSDRISGPIEVIS